MESILLNSTFMSDKECKEFYSLIHKYLKRIKHEWKDTDYRIKIELIKEN